jgi:hypothetical protein
MSDFDSSDSEQQSINASSTTPHTPSKKRNRSPGRVPSTPGKKITCSMKLNDKVLARLTKIYSNYNSWDELFTIMLDFMEPHLLNSKIPISSPANNATTNSNQLVSWTKLIPEDLKQKLKDLKNVFRLSSEEEILRAVLLEKPFIREKSRKRVLNPNNSRQKSEIITLFESVTKVFGFENGTKDEIELFAMFLYRTETGSKIFDSVLKKFDDLPEKVWLFLFIVFQII